MGRLGHFPLCERGEESLQKTYLTYSIESALTHKLRIAHWGATVTDVSDERVYLLPLPRVVWQHLESGAMPLRAGLAQSLHLLTFRPKAQWLARYGETRV